MNVNDSRKITIFFNIKNYNTNGERHRGGGSYPDLETCSSDLAAAEYDAFACCDTDLCNMAPLPKALTGAIVLSVVAFFGFV